MTNRNLLPSKKFLKTLGGIILILLILILIGSIANKKTLYSGKNRKAQVLVVSDAVEKDTDGDGLKDWEEALWGTDPRKPDTDGNGVQDGEQIHKLQETLSIGNKNNPDNLQNDTTKTGAITRDILTIASAISQGGQITPESQNAITDEIAKTLESRAQTAYGIKDITIIDKPTKKQTLAYVYTMKKSVETVTITQNDVELIAEYENNINNNSMSAYTQTAQKFAKERDNIKKLATPEQYIDIHLAYINALQELSALYTDIGQQDEDPAKALSAYASAQVIFDQYQKVLELMQN
jgi:hypothetical protein